MGRASARLRNPVRVFTPVKCLQGVPNNGTRSWRLAAVGGYSGAGDLSTKSTSSETAVAGIGASGGSRSTTWSYTHPLMSTSRFRKVPLLSSRGTQVLMEDASVEAQAVP